MAANSSFSNDPSASGAQVQYSLNSKAMVAAMLILSIVVLFVLTLHVYAKWFWHQRSVGALPLSNARDAPWRRRHHWRLQSAEFTGVDGMLAPTLCVGLHPTTISSLPTFIYQAFKHHDFTEPLLECAVCLSEFQPYEKGRILPDCKHSFHICCIDMWFCSHSTCPLCRAPVLPWTPQHHEQNTWSRSDSASQSSSLALPTKPHDQHIEQTASHSQHLQTASSTATNQCPNEESTGIMLPPPLPHCNPGIHVQGLHLEGLAKNDELLPRYDTKAEARASLWRIDGTYCESSSTRSVSVEIQGQAESGPSIARCQSLGMPRCQAEDTEACDLQPVKSRSFRMSIRWLLSRDLSRARGRIFPSAAGEEGAEEQDYQVEQSSTRSTLPL